MLAVFKKEFRSFFNNVIGWLFIAVNIAFLGLYFFANNLLQGSANVGYIYGYVVFMFIILIPVLTMRIMAQERRDKTDQLIFTAPVSLFSVVMGKYLALVAVFSIPAAVSACFPLLLSAYGDVSIGESYTALLGYWLYGLAAISIGLFLSSLTENIIVSAVITVLVLFLVHIMSFFVNLFSSAPIASKVVSCLNFNERLYDFTTASLSLQAVLYFISVIVIFIFLTINGIRSRRCTYKKRRILRDVGTTAYAVIVIAVIVVGNWGFSKLPEKYITFDVSSQKMYEITEQTREVVNSTDKEITFYVYAKESALGTDIKKTLRHYGEFKNIKIEYVDPQKTPEFAKKYGEESISESSVVVVCGDKYKVVDSSNYFTYDQMSYYYTGSSDPTGNDAEGQITGAIAYVLSEDNPVVYKVTGNGELDLGGEFRSVISKTNMEVKSLDVMRVDSIPEDADALIILAPETDINDDILAMLRAYVEAGGKIYMTLRFTENPLNNWNALISDFGISVESGMVVENDRNHYYQQQDYLLTSILTNTETGTSGGDTTLMIQSVAMKDMAAATEASGTDAEAAAPASNVVALAQTSTSAILKKDIVNAKSVDFEEGDEKGQFLLGAYSEKNNAKLVVFGSPVMTDDSVDKTVSGNNSKLFGNMIGKLVEVENTVSIPSKPMTAQYVTVPSSNVVIIGLVLILLTPLTLIIVGLVIWIRRRKK